MVIVRTFSLRLPIRDKRSFIGSSSVLVMRRQDNKRVAQIKVSFLHLNCPNNVRLVCALFCFFPLAQVSTNVGGPKAKAEQNLDKFLSPLRFNYVE
jgi:hypothetical protein